MLLSNHEKMSKSLGNFYTDPRGAGASAGGSGTNAAAAGAVSVDAGVQLRGVARRRRGIWTDSTARSGMRRQDWYHRTGAGRRCATISTRLRRSRRCTSLAGQAIAGECRDAASGLKAAGGLLGLLQKSAKEHGSRAAMDAAAEAINGCYYRAFRSSKGERLSHAADAIRDKLLSERGVILEDHAGRPTTWRSDGDNVYTRSGYDPTPANPPLIK